MLLEKPYLIYHLDLSTIKIYFENFTTNDSRGTCCKNDTDLSRILLKKLFKWPAVNCVAVGGPVIQIFGKTFAVYELISSLRFCLIKL